MRLTESEKMSPNCKTRIDVLYQKINLLENFVFSLLRLLDRPLSKIYICHVSAPSVDVYIVMIMIKLR